MRYLEKRRPTVRGIKIKGHQSNPESSITQKNEWTYIKYGVEEIRVKEYEGGLEVQRVLPGRPVSQDDFDAAVEIALKKRRAGELGIDNPRTMKKP